MDREYFFYRAKRLLNGEELEMDFFRKILDLKEDKITYLFAGTDLLRENFFGNEIHLCTILNAKSGRCSEDCAFCAQSAHYKSEVNTYPLMNKEKLKEKGIWASNTVVNRYSMVTSGKGLSLKEVERIGEAFAELGAYNIELCASLGTLSKNELLTLKQSGVDRYHHNLETARSFFPQICSTHSYEDRIKTVKLAKELGFSVCCGGIFGLGEKEEHILELALIIKDLNVDSIPLNFLTPIKGTPLESRDPISPMDCLKIIAFFRYFFPEKDIIICGGRKNLDKLVPFIFMAGASGIMTGDYLTTKGFSLEEDLNLLKELGLKPRKNKDY